MTTMTIYYKSLFLGLRSATVMRNAFRRGLRYKKPAVANPGLQNQLDALNEEGVHIRNNDEEFLEESHSDFSKAGKYYQKQKQDQHKDKDFLVSKIIERKYFNVTHPNLLTWSEKEQIRYLYTSDPDDWTPEKLAESFPATVDTIKKLVKYKWQPATEDRIIRHDRSAMRNWKELKEGTIDIPKDLMNHFLKFAERKIPPRIISLSKPKNNTIGEFQAIVMKNSNKNQKVESNSMGEIHTTEGETHTELSSLDKTNYEVKNDNPNDSFKNRPKVTLEELKHQIKTNFEKGNTVELPEILIMKTATESVNNRPTEKDNKIDLYEPDSVEVSPQNEEKEVFGKNYPQRIRIPKSAWKKGATYRVDDCYYDSDGRFLYRVLGMESISFK